MDKVNMSLDEIIKMETVKGSPPTEQVPLETHQHENQDLTNCNSEIAAAPVNSNENQTVNYSRQNRMKMMGGPYWNHYGRLERREDNFRSSWRNYGNYPGNRNNPYGPSRNWNNQRGNYRMFYKTGFKAFRGHSSRRRNNYNWNYYNNNSNLTERSIYHFNQMNPGGGNFRRSASVSNLHFNEGPPYMRNGFVKAGSVTSLNSIRSNVSYHSQRSNKSMRSNYSNASNNSHRSYRSNNSMGSQYSNRSGYNQGSYRPYFNGYRSFKKFRFYLDFDVQREIKKIQVEGQRIRRNSPMSLRDHNVECLEPIVMATSMKLTDRFTSNNA